MPGESVYAVFAPDGGGIQGPTPTPFRPWELPSRAPPGSIYVRIDADRAEPVVLGRWNGRQWLEPEPPLGEQQQAAYDAGMRGESLLVTGPAGTGKSAMLSRLLRDLRARGKIVAMTASTGIAAVSMGGMTIHSTLGLGRSSSIREAEKMRGVETLSKAQERIGNVDVILVDEVSMLRGDFIEMMSWWLNMVMTTPTTIPFGGKQVIFSGDFCLRRGTEIVMYDGSLRRIEQVKVGEQVMGPDSSPREVLRRFAGKAPLYRVEQTNGDPYFVTGNHQLALVRRGQLARFPHLGGRVNVPVREFLVKSAKYREVFGGFKAGCLRMPRRAVAIDPYFLGLWLGDGFKSGPQLTSMDPEVIDYCRRYAIRRKLQFHIRPERKGTPAQRITISGKTVGRRDRDVNTLLADLLSYRLLRNKHIPDCYLRNAVDVRLKLLAGLIDTDGCWSGNRFVYCSALTRLAQQVKRLADHLGFRTALYRNSANTAWTVTIGGDTWRIPTRIKRKQSRPRSLGHSRTNSTLRVTPSVYGVDHFAGIEVSGDSLFVLADGTVTHNCQLPPVVKPGDRVKHKYAFEAPTWEALTVAYLKKGYRQDDKEMRKYLMRLRMGRNDPETLAYFNQRYRAALPDGVVPTKLFPTNAEAAGVNDVMLRKLPGKEYSFDATYEGHPAWIESVQNNMPCPGILDLKVGALVIFIKNNARLGYANGSRGEVVELSEALVKVRLRTGALVEVPREKWALRDAKEKELATVTQYPLMLAWALTTHRGQGQTLDAVEFDPARTFERALAYVAVSRCRTMAGLSLANRLSPEHVKASPRCVAYYRSLQT